MERSDVEQLAAGLPVVVERRVLYGEVDRMDVVYGSHYLTWFENARNEYLRRCGVAYIEVERRGLLLPVIESRVWHLGPVGYDDLVCIRCAVVACTRATATFVFAVERDGGRVATGYTVHACLDERRKPSRLPDWLRDRILWRGHGPRQPD